MPRHAAEIFHEAREIPSAERDSFLRGACGKDLALRAKVEALLEADAEAGGFMASPTADGVARRVPPASDEQPGGSIGRYKLLEQIGEGGMGTIWMAEQREPVRRRVALKIIKLGMDTRQVIARFEAERQALAMMEHPNIAKVLDAGATETGRPYFVMEYIKGIPILEYCDQEKLDTRARLELFTQVCNAIQHAHQKGIIHRDIKPSNVLVTLHDGVPAPKVIDFGIAKATNSELTTKTLFTEHRQMIGTPAYMSPEQAEMSGLDIDTRSDIYSLGVLLYELLTGTTPFDIRTLLAKGHAEMMRAIREEEPHKPSTRVSTLGDTGTRTAMQRRVDAKKLGMLLRGDVDWIVMKCLEKDRSRRYETANALAMDILRHLRDEPVTAGPPSTGYKLRKFVRRNRGQVIAGGAIAALLLLGVVGTGVGLARALRERERADAEAKRANAQAALAEAMAESESKARREAEASEALALAEAERAERELGRANEIKSLIVTMLTSVDPQTARGQDTTLLRRLLDDAAARLARGGVSDDLVAAELHTVIGSVYAGVGLYAQAEAHFPRAVELSSRVLGDEHALTLAARDQLAKVYNLQGRYADAEPLLVENLAVQRRVFGDEHPNTRVAIGALAVLYTNLGRFVRAEELHLEVLEIQRRVADSQDPGTLDFLNNLAGLYWFQERHSEVEPLLVEILDIRRRRLGVEHPDTCTSMSNLALSYAEQGRHAEAEELFLEALDLRERVLGEEHPDTLGTTACLGHLYCATGRDEEAVELLEASLSRLRPLVGGRHPWTQYALQGLTAAYVHLGRDADALPLHREVLEFQTAEADEPAASAHKLHTAARSLLKYELEPLHDPSRALAYAQRACALEEADGGPTLWRLLDTLALAQHRTGDTERALGSQERALNLVPDDAPQATLDAMQAQMRLFEASSAARVGSGGG